jgi:hypothetical protein
VSDGVKLIDGVTVGVGVGVTVYAIDVIPVITQFSSSTTLTM